MTWSIKSGLICLVVAATAIAFNLSAGESGRAPGSGPAARSGPEGLGEKGRYRSAIAGSRGAQRFATAFRIDTATGKAWRSLLYLAEIEPWIEITEDPEAMPESTGEVGRFELTASMVSDRTGQDMASAARIDTRTGRTWAMRADRSEPRWWSIEERTEAKKKP